MNPDDYVMCFCCEIWHKDADEPRHVWPGGPCPHQGSGQTIRPNGMPWDAFVRRAEESTRPKITCPTCSQVVGKRDDGRPRAHMVTTPPVGRQRKPRTSFCPGGGYRSPFPSEATQ